jgi:hypothetical protein
LTARDRFGILRLSASGPDRAMSNRALTASLLGAARSPDVAPVEPAVGLASPRRRRGTPGSRRTLLVIAGRPNRIVPGDLRRIALHVRRGGGTAAG